MKSINTIYLFFVLLLLNSASIFAQGITFTNHSSASGTTNSGTNSGIAYGDYDNDGDEDLYVSVMNGDNILYQNQGNGTFINVTVAAGVAVSVTSTTSVWGDINNDGHLDLYVGNYENPNQLFLNNGDGTFSNISISAGVDHNSKPRSIMMADIDNDGLVDIYVANLSKANVLYKNKGDSTFVDHTAVSGTYDYQIAMGSIFFDYDNDGDQDLYLTHDSYQKYILYQNQGNGTFTNVSQASGTDFAGQGMGVDFADFNNDGHLDMYISNLGPNTFFKNNGDGTFSDIAQQLGVDDWGMGWGTFFMDADNDGLTDLYLINDSFFSPNPNVMYQNTGNDTFNVVSANTDLESMYSALGGASADVDNDGLIDFSVAITGSQGNQLFKNSYSGNNHWIKIKTEGTVSNRAGIGTRVEIHANGTMQINEVAAGRGYASANSLTLHFGVGNATIVDSIVLKWSSGQRDVYYNLTADQYLLAIEGTSLTPMIFTNIDKIHPLTIDIKTFPNPFIQSTQFDFSLKKSNKITLNIYDLQGKLVKQLLHQNLDAGQHSIHWDGTNDLGSKLLSGNYFYHFQSDMQISTGKIILLSK